MENVFHPSWSESFPREACQRAIERHGGWPAWESLGSVRLKPLVLRGFLPRWKGVGESCPLPEAFEVFPREQRVTFLDFPAHGETGEYRAGSLVLNGRLIPRGRGLFDFRQQLLRRWRPEHALYFFGYAWATYLSIPFRLPELSLRRHFAWKGGDAFEVAFPDSFESHGRVQTFYFDESGLLYRHDYHAEVVGPIAYGAHYSTGYRRVNGIEVACRRHVIARIGRQWLLPLTVLHAELEPA